MGSFHMKPVSDAYLLGAAEGRALLRDHRRRHDRVSIEDAEAFRDNCKANLSRGFAGPMADLFRGERDFWTNYIKETKRHDTI